MSNYETFIDSLYPIPPANARWEGLWDGLSQNELTFMARVEESLSFDVTLKDFFGFLRKKSPQIDPYANIEEMKRKDLNRRYNSHPIRQDEFSSLDMSSSRGLDYLDKSFYFLGVYRSLARDYAEMTKQINIPGHINYTLEDRLGDRQDRMLGDIKQVDKTINLDEQTIDYITDIVENRLAMPLNEEPENAEIERTIISTHLDELKHAEEMDFSRVEFLTEYLAHTESIQILEVLRARNLLQSIVEEKLMPVESYAFSY